MNKRKKDNKILSFDRDAEFYYNQYQKNNELGKCIDALFFIRKAVAIEPEEPLYRLAMAELLTEMNCFDESNLIMFDILRNYKEYAGECLFGIGCNFIGLQDFERAKESFEKYLNMEPFGEFELEAEDLLEMIDMSDLVMPGRMLEDLNESLIFDAADQGKQLLDSGKYHDAIQLLEKISRDNPNLVFVKNNLALAYFCSGDHKKAIEITDEVLAGHPQNLHANCNKALFMAGIGDESSMDSALGVIDKLKPVEPEEATKAAVTMCELKQHKRAIRALSNLLDVREYDIKTMFLLAVAYANIGNKQEAIRWLTDILKIDPYNFVALYYNQLIQSAAKDKQLPEISYSYSLPLSEIRSKIAYLNDCMRREPGELKKLWEKDDYFYTNIVWGLQVSDLSVKRAVIDIISRFGDDKVVYTLKKYIMDRSEPDEIKNEVFVILKQLGAAEPYVAYLDGKISEVRVGMLNVSFNMKESHKRVIEILVDKAQLKDNDKTLVMGLEIWEQYLEKVHPGPLKKPQCWAAALECIVRSELKLRVDRDEICEQYDVENTKLEGYIRKILAQTGR